jgi:hypothetical protein
MLAQPAAALAYAVSVASPDVPSTAAAREVRETYIRSAWWFETNVPEPVVGDLEVPACALLLARPGHSVYRVFVETKRDRKGKPVYHCCASACAFKSDRLHRVIGHQRNKRNHRPFVCPDEGWCVVPMPM